MNNSNIKAVIFDLGNVWIDFDHMIAARRISQFAEKSPQEIFDLFFDSEMTKQFEEGRMGPYDFFLGVEKRLNLKISYDEFIKIWNEIFFLSEKNIKTHNLANLLKQSHTIAMLSNVNILHFQYLKERFPVFDIFDNIILSYQVHLRKPDHQIYRMALDILNRVPKEVAYIDDRREFTEEANTLGIRSFYFEGPDKLKADFASADINLY